MSRRPAGGIGKSWGGPDIALFSDGAGYVTKRRPPARPAFAAPVGLMGGQVAGREFRAAGSGRGAARAAVAWRLKYDLMRVGRPEAASQGKMP